MFDAGAAKVGVLYAHSKFDALTQGALPCLLLL